VLTNSTATFSVGTAIVSGRDKNQVAGLELKETMIPCGQAAQTTNIKSIRKVIYIFIFSKKPRDFSQDFFILYYDINTTRKYQTVPNRPHITMIKIYAYKQRRHCGQEKKIRAITFENGKKYDQIA
jgi:hypothetical protein